jgi:hypothetical protein
MLSLVFGWEAFIPLQIIGFVVLSLGAFTFGEAISFRKCLPSLYPPEAPVSDAEQPLLSRSSPRINHPCIVISSTTLASSSHTLRSLSEPSTPSGGLSPTGQKVSLGKWPKTDSQQSNYQG